MNLEEIKALTGLVDKICEGAKIVQTVATTIEKGDYETRKLREKLVVIAEKLLEKKEAELTGSVDLTPSEKRTLEYTVNRLQDENRALKAEVNLHEHLQKTEKKEEEIL